jgi:lipopolysaccharide/colanic/teichoic acid biosynthesis glycosyltransferase
MPNNGSPTWKAATNRKAVFCSRFVRILAWLGAILRRLSLDELPQLYNVLLGEMSLVGPRPLQIRDSERLQALDPIGYKRRLEVLPGVTGPWQVGGRSQLNHESMVQLDVDYVDNWSLGRDLAIISKTFFVVLLRVGAY